MKILDNVFFSIREIYNELIYKVSYPNKQELSASTAVVLIASLVMSLVVFIIDFTFESFIAFFYKIFF